MGRLDELERKFEENPRRYFAPLANEYRKSGDARRAVELCQSQLPEVPGHISGHIVLGQALFDVRDFAASRTALETALTLDPENIVALRYLGDIARDTGDGASAERWYRRTLEADPYNEAATAGLQSLQDHPHAAEPDTEPVAETAPETSPEAAADAHIEPIVETHPETFSEPAADAASEPGVETGSEAAQHEPVVEAGPETSQEPEPAPVHEVVAAEEQWAESFEPTTQAPEDEPQLEETAESVEASQFTGDLEISAVPDRIEVSGEQEATPSPDNAALDVQEEPIQTEERVMESAAPFVTETMADLYLEQGYPHEALELLLQLYEQRPDDDQLATKIEHLESVIIARRDSAVAAARAERAEALEPEPEYEAELHAEHEHEPEPETQPEARAASTMREMFARMDRARPRPRGSVTPGQLDSDFVPLPDPSDASMSSDDPFGFPNPATRSEGVPRASGPQPTFNPSTAADEDFDAWLRGLKGS